jgi:hypothetical protein
VERSITQGTPGDGAAAGPGSGAAAELEAGGAGSGAEKAHWAPFLWGIALIALCMSIYVATNLNRQNFYIHFVWQAQAWLDGQTSIPIHVQGSGTPETPGNSWYQDIQPILDSSGADTNRGTIPFPPLPAIVLLPFVAFWHLATNEQLLAAIFAALDVGIAFWMLGYLPVRQEIRRLTALFLGLGTVLWYAAAIGTTWFWAHVVAVGCLTAAVGFALSADRDGAGPRPLAGLAKEIDAARPREWPGRWRSAATIVVLGVLGELLFTLAGAGSTAAIVAGIGVLLSIGAAILALAVSGQRGVVLPILIVAAIVGGVPAALVLGAQLPVLLAAVDVAVLALVVALAVLARIRPQPIERAMAAFWDALAQPETRQVAAGLLFGLACTARLTIVFGFPFLILVGGGNSWLRRGLLAGAGAAVPLVALLVYTFAGTGHLFNPAYDYLYHLELGYASFNYNPAWSIEDIRYIPQNLRILLFGLPRFFPAGISVFPGDNGTPVCVGNAARGLFDKSCPIAIPEAVGQSIFLTSPAYLLAPLAFLPALRRRLDRVTVGAAVAVFAIAFINLMHFSQGWVQFGYRFSNDFSPFAIVLVALGASRLGRFWPVLVPLVVASIAINLWGTVWGVMLGW